MFAFQLSFLLYLVSLQPDPLLLSDLFSSYRGLRTLSDFEHGHLRAQKSGAYFRTNKENTARLRRNMKSESFYHLSLLLTLLPCEDLKYFSCRLGLLSSELGQAN